MCPGGRGFSGACRMTDMHDAVSAEVGNATWVSESIPADRSFIEALLGILHDAGMYCAVVGEYATYMAGGLSNWNDVTICVASLLEKI